MLQAIRDRAQGVIAWIIIILIIIPFALWGINEYTRDDTVLLVAEVDGEPVPVDAYQRAYQSERNFRLQLLGNRADLLDNESIKRSALDRLVNAVALAKAARDEGYRIGDAQLAAVIRGMREFQEGGRFDAARYASLLNSLGMTQAQFETDLRQDLLAEQLATGLTESEFVSSIELVRYVALYDQTRDFSSLRLAPDAYLDQVTVTDADIEAAYESEHDRYMNPERVRIDYIELSVADIKRTIPAPDDELLRRRYEERKADFGLPEERRASHILVAVPKDADEAEVEAARRKALEIKKEIDGGASFETLARERSDDPGSAKKGGDLGYFSRGVMDAPFEEAVFAMQPGEITGPVRSRFGFHVIRLDDIRKGAVKPFEEVRDRLRDEIVESQAEERFYDLADRLTDLAFENPDSLEPVAEALGVEVRTSDYFDREAGQGIASEERIRAAAFSDDVLNRGNNSEPVELGNQRLVVLRVAERKPAERKPLAEVRGVIEQELRRKRLAERTEAEGKALIERLRRGDPLETVAREAGSEWENHEALRRDATDLDGEVRDRVFTLSRPAENEIVYGGVSVADGGYVVIALKRVTEGRLDDLDDARRRQRRAALLVLLRNSDGRALVEGVKSRFEIRIFEQNL